MELAVHTQDGKASGKVTIEDTIAKQEPNQQAIFEAVRLFLANQRQGTAKTKERSEVHGTNKKPYRQKGTGNARAGDVKSPLWRHGGTIFGPRPRQYGFKLNKKVAKLARRSALALKLQHESVLVLEAYKAEAPKTQQFLQVLNKLSLAEEKVLVIAGAPDKVLYYSARNLPNVHVTTAQQVSTYELMNASKVLILKDAIDHINAQFA